MPRTYLCARLLETLDAFDLAIPHPLDRARPGSRRRSATAARRQCGCAVRVRAVHGMSQAALTAAIVGVEVAMAQPVARPQSLDQGEDACGDVLRDYAAARFSRPWPYPFTRCSRLRT